MRSSPLNGIRKSDRSHIRPLDTGLVQDNVPAEVIPGLFIGSIHAGFNQEGLNDLGITHILNASGMPATFPNSFTYFTVSVRDKEQASILSCIPASNIFIEAGLDKGSVLVHCAGGRSRSASFVVAFLMSSRSMSYDDAVQITRAARPVISINRGFEEQLRAYGTMSCDIYKAQQYVLRSRVRDLFALRQAYKSQLTNGEISLQDPTPLEKFKKKISLPSKDTPRPSAPCFINGQLPNARLRLSRPRSASVQVIPPLRGLEKVYICNKCGSYLFTIANILRMDIPVSEEVDSRIKQSMTNPITSSEPYDATGRSPCNSRNSSRKKALKNNIECMDALSMTEPTVPQTTKHATQSRKEFSFGSFDDLGSPSSNYSHPKVPTLNKGRRGHWDDSAMKEETLDDLSPLSSPMQVDLPLNQSPSQASNSDDPILEPLEKKSTNRVPNLPILDNSRGQNNSSETLSPSLSSSPSSSPNSHRPLSAEKRRWLQKMLLLDSSGGKRAFKAACQDEEMSTISSSSSFIYLEYMPWFGEILYEDQGPILCPTETCKTQLGEYSWIGGFEVPRPMGVGLTMIGPPKFAIFKASISQAALIVESSCDSPRLTLNAEDSPSQRTTSTNKTLLPQITKKSNSPKMWLKNALSRSSSRSRSNSRQSSPKIGTRKCCSVESNMKGENSRPTSLTISTTHSDL